MPRHFTRGLVVRGSRSVAELLALQIRRASSAAARAAAATAESVASEFAAESVCPLQRLKQLDKEVEKLTALLPPDGARAYATGKRHLPVDENHETHSQVNSSKIYTKNKDIIPSKGTNRIEGHYASLLFGILPRFSYPSYVSPPHSPAPRQSRPQSQAGIEETGLGRTLCRCCLAEGG